MLSKRPLLSLTTTFAIGCIIARYYPKSSQYILQLIVVWTTLTIAYFIKKKKKKIKKKIVPEEYEKIILPEDGFINKKGTEKFFIILAILTLIIGIARQGQVNEKIKGANEKIPEKFLATIVVDSINDKNSISNNNNKYWQINAILTQVNDEKIEKIKTRISGFGKILFKNGDKIKINVEKEKIKKPEFPGDINNKYWLEINNLQLSLKAVKDQKQYDVAYRIDSNNQPGIYYKIKNALENIRKKAVQNLLSYKNKSQTALLATMIFGYHVELPSNIKNNFRKIGIGHVLAISGLHVGLVAALIWWIMGFAVHNHSYRAACCIVAIVTYLALSGARVAAIRATIMAVIYLIGILIGRKGDIFNSLAAAAAIIIAYNPAAIIDISFQLSFIAVIAIAATIAIYYKYKKKKINLEIYYKKGWTYWKFKIKKNLTYLIIITLAAWIANFPLVIYNFNQINLAGIIVNIIIVPLTSIVIAGGIILAIIKMPEYIEEICLIPTKILIYIAQKTTEIPYAYINTNDIESKYVVIFYCCIVAIVAYCMNCKKIKIKYIVAQTIILTIVTIIIITKTMKTEYKDYIAILPNKNIDTIIYGTKENKTYVINNDKYNDLKILKWLKYAHAPKNIELININENESYNYELENHYNITKKKNDYIEKNKNIWQVLDQKKKIKYKVKYYKNKPQTIIIKNNDLIIAVTKKKLKQTKKNLENEKIKKIEIIIADDKISLNNEKINNKIEQAIIIEKENIKIFQNETWKKIY